MRCAAARNRTGQGYPDPTARSGSAAPWVVGFVLVAIVVTAVAIFYYGWPGTEILTGAGVPVAVESEPIVSDSETGTTETRMLPVVVGRSNDGPEARRPVDSADIERNRSSYDPDWYDSKRKRRKPFAELVFLAWESIRGLFD